MADNKSKQGARDRSRVAAGETYEVEYFAQKHGITPQKARDLIKQYGNSREVLDIVAEGLKRS